MKNLLLLILLCLLAGCGVKKPVEARLDPWAGKQVMISDDQLRDETAVGVPALTRDAGGLLHVSVPVRAAKNKQIFVDYRVTFVDRNSQVLWQTAWIPKILEPNVPDAIQANSPTAMAADFQLDLRYSR